MLLDDFSANSDLSPYVFCWRSLPSIGKCIESLMGSKYVRLGFLECR